MFTGLSTSYRSSFLLDQRRQKGCRLAIRYVRRLNTEGKRIRPYIREEATRQQKRMAVDPHGDLTELKYFTGRV